MDAQGLGARHWGLGTRLVGAESGGGVDSKGPANGGKTGSGGDQSNGGGSGGKGDRIGWGEFEEKAPGEPGQHEGKGEAGR